MCDQVIWDDVPRDYDEQRQRALVATAPTAMAEITAEGHVSLANARWVELIAAPSSGVVESQWFDAVHPDDLTRVMDVWRTSSSERAGFTIECRIVRPDGANQWIEFHAAPLLDRLTETTTFIVIAMDVTERRYSNEIARTTLDLETWAEQSAAALAQQGRDLGIFAALVASSADAIVIVDPNEQVRYANGTFHALFDVVIDHSWPDLLTGLGVDEKTARALYSANLAGEPWRSMVTLKRPRQVPLHVDMSSFPIVDEASRRIGLAIVIRDLSAQKEVEIEHARLHAEILNAQESAIRELSTPLLPIGPGILAMPLIGTIDTKRGQQLLETLLSGIQAHRATVAILDVTGVRQINADVADILIRSAKAAKLLGTNVILTGVGPFVAKTLIQLGTDLNGVNTLATLEQGIYAAFASKRSHTHHDRRNGHPVTK